MGSSIRPHRALLVVQLLPHRPASTTTSHGCARCPPHHVRARSQLPAVVALLQGLAALRRWLQPLYDVRDRVEAWREAQMEE